ncbi:MAG: chromate resistance protein ChrB [Actinomycetota bacterium]|nr:chromate resistance protein ChrB [Actinomycetota bacterium]
MDWIVLVLRLPAEPSRHRVAVWRELRRGGAVQLAPGSWAFPAQAAFTETVDRVLDLVRRGDGEVVALDARARDEAGSARLRATYTDAREAEWTEFLSDCAKYQAELDHEIAVEKYTLAELDEEEQSMERLRRWHRELGVRDVFGAPSSPAAGDRLAECATRLDDYTERVFQALHAEPPPP